MPESHHDTLQRTSKLRLLKTLDTQYSHLRFGLVCRPFCLRSSHRVVDVLKILLERRLVELICGDLGRDAAARQPTDLLAHPAHVSMRFLEGLAQILTSSIGPRPRGYGRQAACSGQKKPRARRSQDPCRGGRSSGGKFSRWIVPGHSDVMQASSMAFSSSRTLPGQGVIRGAAPWPAGRWGSPIRPAAHIWH